MMLSEKSCTLKQIYPEYQSYKKNICAKKVKINSSDCFYYLDYVSFPLMVLNSSVFSTFLCCKYTIIRKKVNVIF